jgi:hypothetical protein
MNVNAILEAIEVMYDRASEKILEEEKKTTSI